MKDTQPRTHRKGGQLLADYGTVIFEDNDDVKEPKVDMTQSLPVRSKRTERKNKKSAKKSLLASTTDPRGPLDLPYELLFPIICMLQPSDVITLLGVCKPIRNFILSEEARISKHIIRLRYNCLAKCFRRPVLLRNVDPALHHRLQSPDRPEMAVNMHKRAQHIQPPNLSVTCTCLTCMSRWTSLCIAVDFQHWQKNLNNGQPITIIPRGHTPEWNQKLLAHNAKIVLHALHSDLFYARILEAHLASTVGSIRRHAENKGNRRRRFRMTEDDLRRGTADFLERSGPPTVEVPYHRDNYYMLEAFMPSRSWIKDSNEWVYMPEEQHEKDLNIAVQWEAWSKGKQAAARRLEEEQALHAEQDGAVAALY